MPIGNLLQSAAGLPQKYRSKPKEDISQSLGKFAREKLARQNKFDDELILMKSKAGIQQQIFKAQQKAKEDMLQKRIDANKVATEQLNAQLGFNKQLNGGQQRQTQPQARQQFGRVGFESPEAQQSIAGTQDFGTLQRAGGVQSPVVQEEQRGREFGKMRQPPFISHLGKTIKNPMFISPKSKADASELTGEQEVKARALARKISGVRGAERILPAITKLIKEGKTIDEVEDMIRFGSQSSEFTGVIRDTAQQILINSPAGVSDRAMDFIDDRLSKGDMTGVKSMFKRLARKDAGADVSKSIMGKDRTVEFLGEIRNDLNALQQSGVDTNIFTGSIENINAKIGRVNDPELRKVATKIKVAIMNYRRSMSGAAFSVPESEEYKDLFPSISRTANFNAANISALSEVMQGDLDNFYSLSMGRENYNKLFGNSTQTISSATPDGTQFTYKPIGQ